ncbi:hypothetical protein PSSY5922_30360 [Pseudomonas synxantha]
MVLSDDQHVIVRCQCQQLDPQQRAVLQVEQLLGFVFDPRTDRLRVGFRPRFDTHCQVGVGGDALHGAFTLLGERGAQALMAGNQAVKAALQGLGVQVAAQAQGRRDVVGRAAGIELPEEPLAFLGIGQRQRLIALNPHQWRLMARRLLRQAGNERM